jgi:HPr kinase/phosphorylase
VSTSPGSVTVDGSVVVIGEDGVLIRGKSGAGKSSLARDLVAAAEAEGRYGALVSDDRVILAERHGRLVASAVPAVAGLIEIRGLGIVRVPFQNAAVIRLLVDLEADPPRLPDDSALIAAVGGVSLPRIVVNAALATRVVMWRLGRLRDSFVTVP